MTGEPEYVKLSEVIVKVNDMANTLVCKDCGVLVVDKNAHDRDHARKSEAMWILSVLKVGHISGSVHDEYAFEYRFSSKKFGPESEATRSLLEAALVMPELKTEMKQLPVLQPSVYIHQMAGADVLLDMEGEPRNWGNFTQLKNWICSNDVDPDDVVMTNGGRMMLVKDYLEKESHD